MKKAILFSLWVLFVLCFSPLPIPAQTDGELDQILSRLKDRFGSAKTFQADYLRDLLPKVPSQLPPQSLQAEGQLSFRSPGKLRLVQKKPRPEQLISNGEKVWWYVPEEKVVYVYALKDYYLQIKPILDFLSGLGRLDQHYRVSPDPSVPPEASYSGLILEPKTPQADLNRIFLKISKSTVLPVEFSFYNVLGDGTRFRFSRIQSGLILADSLFNFTPPPGTESVSQTPQPSPRK
jgi:outer membrane lipoprotein carrier protein